jgi:uncharacterized membrane protein
MAGDVHAALVHFPIALVITAVAFHVIALVWRSESFARAARYLIIGAAIGGALAVAAGFWALYQLGPFGELRTIAHRHRLFGIITGAFLLLAAIWTLVRERRTIARPSALSFLLALIAGGLVLITGDLGGDVAGWGR